MFMSEMIKVENVIFSTMDIAVEIHRSRATASDELGNNQRRVLCAHVTLRKVTLRCCSMVMI